MKTDYIPAGRPPGSAPAGLLADMELVHRQLHCVQHLCKAVSELAAAKAQLLPRTALMGSGMGHHLIKMDGDWSNSFMQWVGDMLNNMDATDPEEDKHWAKTFEEAGERWKNLTAELNAKSAND